jgi:hypothetical protein
MPFPTFANGESNASVRSKINAALTFLGLKESDINSIGSKENVSNKGAANGYAPLDATAKIPSINLPSYVDDILEYANLAAFPVVGETGKIYIAIDTGKQYRWSGAVYVAVTNGFIATTTDVPEGLNLYFTTARVLATVLTGISFASGAVITAADTILIALGSLQKQLSRNLLDLQTITAGSFALNSATFTDIIGVTLTTKTNGGESNVYQVNFSCNHSQTGTNPHNFRIVYESSPGVFTQVPGALQSASLFAGENHSMNLIGQTPAMPVGRIIKVQKQKVGMSASTNTSTNHVMNIRGTNSNNIIP